MRRAEAELVRAIDDGDVLAVTALLAADPALATAELEWSDGRGAALSSEAISYASMARFHGRADHDRAGEVARALLDGGAPVEGAPGAQETPIVTAASYDEPDVVRVLIERGADVRGRGFAAPGGTALAHATYFGNGEVARILVEAGAPVGSVAEAIAAGVGGEVPLDEQGAYALRAAAVCDRPEGIERVLAVGVPVDAVAYGGTALQWAAWFGRVRSVRHLVERGADAQHRDETHGGRAIDWCRYRHGELFRPSPGHAAVLAYLAEVG